MNINKNNFFLNTRAQFTECTEPDGWHIDYKSSSGSEYYYTPEGVYRCSNHWGGVASCHWMLHEPEYHGLLVSSEKTDWTYAYCKWSDFTILEHNTKMRLHTFDGYYSEIVDSADIYTEKGFTYNGRMVTEDRLSFYWHIDTIEISTAAELRTKLTSKGVNLSDAKNLVAEIFGRKRKLTQYNNKLCAIYKINDKLTYEIRERFDETPSDTIFNYTPLVCFVF